MEPEFAIDISIRPSRNITANALFGAGTHSSTECARTGEGSAVANAFDVVESGLKTDRDRAGTVRKRGRRFLSILAVTFWC